METGFIWTRARRRFGTAGPPALLAWIRLRAAAAKPMDRPAGEKRVRNGSAHGPSAADKGPTGAFEPMNLATQPGSPEFDRHAGCDSRPRSARFRTTDRTGAHSSVSGACWRTVFEWGTGAIGRSGNYAPLGQRNRDFPATPSGGGCSMVWLRPSAHLHTLPCSGREHHSCICLKMLGNIT